MGRGRTNPPNQFTSHFTPQGGSPRTLPAGRWRALGAVLPAAALVTAGCSSASSTGSSADTGGTYTIWDPYPQFANDSAWVALLTKCGSAAGVTVKRTGY